METELSTASNMLFYIFSFIFGTIVGSFLNVCIYRLPLGESIVFPPSHCTNCSAPIKPYHNIPILSYLMLGGKCSSCKAGISVIYPVVELISGLLTLFLFYKFGFSLLTLIYAIFLLSLVVVTFIDLKHMIIPNVITFPGILIGFIFSLFLTDWGLSKKLLGFLDLSSFAYIVSKIPALDSFLGILLGGGILFLIAFVYKLLRKREGMGMGDIKLLAMMGAFLGVKGVVFIIFLSSLIGSVVGISLILYNKGDMKYAMPYGPFLSIAAIIYVFTGGFNFLF